MSMQNSKKKISIENLENKNRRISDGKQFL